MIAYVRSPCARNDVCDSVREKMLSLQETIVYVGENNELFFLRYCFKEQIIFS